MTCRDALQVYEFRKGEEAEFRNRVSHDGRVRGGVGRGVGGGISSL